MFAHCQALEIRVTLGFLSQLINNAGYYLQNLLKEVVPDIFGRHGGSVDVLIFAMVKAIMDLVTDPQLWLN
jgi:hypothetical protein